MAPVTEADFPWMATLRQEWPSAPALDVAAAIERGFPLAVRSGSRVAVAVGSRGIARIDEVVRAVVVRLESAGALPFIVPAMGSHGGATAEGQAGVLAACGVTPATVGAPIRPSMEVAVVGTTADGLPVHLAVEALRSDGIVVVNRVKPHTDLHGPVESGLLEMIAVGLGKLPGAATFHAGVQRLGFERMIAEMARVKLSQAPFLAGVALIENQRHELSKVEVLRADELETREPALLEQARALMARLPFDDIDLLIVDRMGKNISGAGMDPNVIGREPSGYSSALLQTTTRRPFVRRLFVRDLTLESHGNAIGLGMADFTTTRLVRSIDRDVTQMNVLTSLSVTAAKIPLDFSTDREALAAALATLALDDVGAARVVRIRDTLALGSIEISSSLAREVEGSSGIRIEGPPAPFRFDGAGNLVAIGERS